PPDPAVEPEPEDTVELLDDVRVPPVELRLVAREVVQVVLAGRGIERPGRASEVADPVVRRPAVGGGRTPDVVVASPRPPRPARILEPGVLVARVAGDEVEYDRDRPARGL